MVNRGEKKQFFIENDHEGIIPRDVFDRVQEEIERRADKYSPKAEDAGRNENAEKLKRPDGKYLFSGKITCGVCGRHFCRKKNNAGTAYSSPAWVCDGYGSMGKKACTSRRVPENVLIPITAELLGVSGDDLPVVMDRVEAMTLFPDGRVEAVIDGQRRTAAWGNISRRESWDDERRKRASVQMKEVWNRRKGQ